MIIKHKEAMMTGTVANPSSPSVKLTALLAPTMTKIAKGMNSEFGRCRRGGHACHGIDGACGDNNLKAQAYFARHAVMGAAREFTVIIHEADQTEADRDKQYGPDIKIRQIGPKQRAGADRD